MNINKPGQDVGIQNEPEDRQRAHLYRLLAHLLARPPDADILALLGAITINRRDDDFGGAWQALKEVVARAEVAAVEDEFNRLFIGVGRGELLPYASWYRSGSLLERPLIEARRELRTLGIERLEGVPEPEDHIATLCEAMAVIIDFPEAGRWQRQRHFFQCHLAPWAGRFFSDLQRAQAAGFYRPVGLLGGCFMALEEAYFNRSE